MFGKLFHIHSHHGYKFPATQDDPVFESTLKKYRSVQRALRSVEEITRVLNKANALTMNAMKNLSMVLSEPCLSSPPCVEGDFCTIARNIGNSSGAQLISSLQSGFVVPFQNKLASMDLLDRAIAERMELKHLADESKHDLHVAEAVICKDRRRELRHVVDTAELERRMNKKHKKHVLHLKQLEQKHEKVSSALALATRSLISELQHVIDTIPAFVESTTRDAGVAMRAFYSSNMIRRELSISRAGTFQPSMNNKEIMESDRRPSRRKSKRLSSRPHDLPAERRRSSFVPPTPKRVSSLRRIQQQQVQSRRSNRSTPTSMRAQAVGKSPHVDSHTSTYDLERRTLQKNLRDAIEDGRTVDTESLRRRLSRLRVIHNRELREYRERKRNQ